MLWSSSIHYQALHQVFLLQCFFSLSYFIFKNFISQRKKSVDFDFLKLQISWFLNNKKFKIRKVQINFLIIIIHILHYFFYLNWQRLKSLLFINISDKASSNNLNARIEIIVQHMMCNLDVQFQQQNSDSAANIISFSVFKLEEIEYFDSELNI